MTAAAVGAAVLLSGCQYHVALFGDVPYAASKEDDYERLIDAVNADTVAFSSHVGDFQARTATCTDAAVQKNISWFDSLDEPLIFTPGDNDWTDCDDPLGRLARLRQLIFRGTGTTSRGGTTRSLLSQADLGYPENARWTQAAVTYVTVHVVGSSDGTGAERTARRAAGIAWVRQAFASARARGDKGIVVIGHSGLRFEMAEGAKGSYEQLFVALREETQAFAGQVLYVHGDGHHFTDDRPMRTPNGQTVANFRRLEVYGDPTVRWVKLTVDDATPGVFTITSPPTP